MWSCKFKVSLQKHPKLREISHVVLGSFFITEYVITGIKMKLKTENTENYLH